MLAEVTGFSTGRVRGKARARGVRRYAPGGWDTETLPVNVFVVRHPAGICLFDVGQTAAAAGPGHLPRWHPYLRLARFELSPGDEAADQLSRLGVAPEDVRWVVLSHLHTDHVGGLRPFRHADVIVSRREWRTATGLGGRVRGYLPQHWPAGLVPRFADLSGPPVGPFRASQDLALDGSLLVVPTPGHTAGHLGLLVTGARTWLCAGDLAHTPDELTATAPAIAEWCRREKVTVLTAHDDEGPLLAREGARSAGGEPA